MVNLSRIDLNLFAVFDAIYAEGGITRASQRLKLSQPAISHALARLRALLDDPLFVREGHLMVPTPRAEGLIGPVRRALQEIENSLRQLQAFEPAQSTRRFRVGLRHILESVSLPPLVARVQALAPNVEIAAVHHERDHLSSLLAIGELDVAIDVLLPRLPNVSQRHLMGSQMVVALRDGHPALRDGVIDLPAYLDAGHVLASSRKSGPALEDLALRRLGHTRRIRVRCQSWWTACQVVAATDLLLTMPRRYAREPNAALGNRAVPFPLETPANDVYLYWHDSVDQDPTNRWLRAQVEACFLLE